jgi:hypothetical protein
MQFRNNNMFAFFIQRDLLCQRLDLLFEQDYFLFLLVANGVWDIGLHLKHELFHLCQVLLEMARKIKKSLFQFIWKFWANLLLYLRYNLLDAFSYPSLIIFLFSDQFAVDL